MPVYGIQASALAAVVTHSPINFGGRSIDHNVLFCSLVFLPAAFDSIRGCGESIYLSRCHEPLVMDGGCSLTLTPKREAVPRTCPYSPPSASHPDFRALSSSYVAPRSFRAPRPQGHSARVVLRSLPARYRRAARLAFPSWRINRQRVSQRAVNTIRERTRSCEASQMYSKERKKVEQR